MSFVTLPVGRWERFVLVSLFTIPFLLIAAAYDKLPSEVPVLRVVIGHAVLFAQKSPFIIFRVPVMNLIHGTMAAMMLSYAPVFVNAERRIGYTDIFSTLLYTIGLKSTFEGLEFIAQGLGVCAALRYWLAFFILLCVVGGLVVALWRSRKVPLPWPELRLQSGQIFALAGLFTLYLIIVAISLLSSHRIG
jgi:hypothetical protein